MIDSNTVEQIKKAPVGEKIQIIEDILEALKKDIQIDEKPIMKKPFKVKKISLGNDVHINRDELYLERGL